MKSTITDQWGAFTAVPNEFIDNAGTLSDQARWLFVLLRRYTNGESGKAFPGYDFIQAQTGWTPKTIAKAIKELIESEWMERSKRFGKPSEYTLKRPARFFPVGSNEKVSISSLREVHSFPTGSTLLPCGKSNKIEYKKTDSKKTKILPASPEGAPPSPEAPKKKVNHHFEAFRFYYRKLYGYDYSSVTADFVMLAKWQKADGARPEGPTPVEEFDKALRNYMATPQANHTVKDFISRFPVFHRSALDRYGKPVLEAAPVYQERRVNINTGGIGVLVQ